MEQSLLGRWMRSALPVALAIALLAVLAPVAPAAYAQTAPVNAWALTTANELIRFDSAAPRTITWRLPVLNLKPGEQLLGIDFRPATGRLYGVGSTSQIYVIDTQTGFASPIGAPLSTPLSGGSFGVDFNPTVDRLRIVSDSGQNLRVNPDSGALVMADGPLAYAPGDANAGAAPMAVASAYTNPDNDPATGTTLYNIDAGLDTLVSQIPPNNGTLNTVGPLGLDVGAVVGFDITRNDDALGMAALAPAGGGPARLYCVDLASGATIDRGAIGGGETIVGFAVALNLIDRSECR